MKTILGLFLVLIIASCHQPAAPADQSLVERPGIKDTSTAGKAATDTLAAAIQTKEQTSSNKKETTDTLGGLVTTISFEVKTNNRKDYPDGIIPYASIEKAPEDIPNLVDRDKVVIHDTAIRIIIDKRSTVSFMCIPVRKPLGKPYVTNFF
jgi:hypothetical protein